MKIIEENDIMFGKGRGRRLGKQMPGLPVQMFSQLSGERSDWGKPQVFRGSAHLRSAKMGWFYGNTIMERNLKSL